MTSYKLPSSVQLYCETDPLTRRDKPLMVIFEGSDKVGKSTIYQLFRRATNYGPLVIDRFTGSNIVYDQLYGRPCDLDKYYDIEDQVNQLFNVVVVWLVCDPDIQAERINEGETGLDHTKAINNFGTVNRLYSSYIQNTRYPMRIRINTTNTTPQETVEDLLLILKEVYHVL